MAVSIKYEGMRDSAGYRVFFHDGPDSFDHEDEPIFPERTSQYSITAEQGTQVAVMLDGLDDLLFSKIAELDPLNYRQVREFIDEYGFLAPPIDGKLDAQVIEEGVSRLRAALEAALQAAREPAASRSWIQFERETTTLLNKKWSDSAPARTTEVRRVPGNHRPPQTFEIARDLFTFATLQLSVAIGEGAEVKRCAQCENFFAVGPSTSRKRDAIYCSDRCRVAKHRAGQE